MTSEQTASSISTQADEQVSPFVTGAKVALRDSNRWGANHWQQFEVEKRFKNGRFTLKGRDGQWNEHHPRPRDSYGEKFWYAHRAGDNRYHDGTVFIWDDRSDAMIREGFAQKVRERRLSELQRRFGRLKYGDTTDEMLDAIEAALPPKPSND